MRLPILLPLLLFTVCDFSKAEEPTDLKHSVVRLNSTVQSWNPGQPWEKTRPASRRALAAIVGPQQVLTTAELVADATNLEFESPDGTLFAPAKVIAVDYEANLALLGPAAAATGDPFFAPTRPVAIAAPATIGQTLEIYQIDDNGVELRTPGSLRSIICAANFLAGQPFLTYQIKASMQSAASSYSIPVFDCGKLTGVLSSYNSKDQLCDVTATDIVARFIAAATTTAPYVGFPSIGVAIARTEDPSFRQWLKLPETQGGIYLSSVRKGGAAAAAGVRKGDVLLAIDGHAIDRRGYYEHPTYGSLSWGHLVRGEKSVGDTVTLSLIRAGEPLVLKATLTREDEHSRLVPNYTFGTPPNYLLKGGFIFQELTRPMLEAFGEEWTSQAPLALLDVFENPDKYQDRADHILFLSAVIPTPATVGYESLRNLIVRKVNGQQIRNMKDLVAAFKNNPTPLHSIQFDQENFTVNLDEAAAASVDAELLKRGIPKLSRVLE